MGRSNGPLRLLQFGMLIKVDTPSLLDSVHPPKESNSLLIKIMTRSLSLSLSQWTDLVDLEQAPSTSKLTLETENLSSLLLSVSFLTVEILILLPSGHLCRFQSPGLLQI